MKMKIALPLTVLKIVKKMNPMMLLLGIDPIPGCPPAPPTKPNHGSDTTCWGVSEAREKQWVNVSGPQERGRHHISIQNFKALASQVQSFRFLFVLYSDVFSIKIGEIICFLGDSCCNDVNFTITASEEDKQSKNFETKSIEVSLKLPNQSSVKAFSFQIKVKRKNDGNVRFSQDQDQNGKKGELLSDLLLCSSENITFFSHHRGLCITVFNPGGVVVKPLSVAKVLDDYGEILCHKPQSHNEGETYSAIIVFDLGGKLNSVISAKEENADAVSIILEVAIDDVLVILCLLKQRVQEQDVQVQHVEQDVSDIL
ncbi:hypothetical protein L195_g016507 [Trifolium pratense]|uniref:Uncharacterized protein n=1 Tax=Trifolium pratense TaxID=57577 RepID=A0A2K3MRD0_TRIPR|nr:hypothetical protein L195_g016507 [Trifolium pratense]